MTLAPTLLLDRDGVINHDRPDYIRSIEQFRFLPGVLEALARLEQAKVAVVIITNQACVGKGLISPAELQAIHDHLRQRVAEAGGRIHAIFHCPHTNEDHCPCRKPKPGLILAAQRELGFPFASTWMVGDAVRDVTAALAAGCRPAIVRTGKGAATAAELPEVTSFATLTGFVDHFLENLSPS
ncbi:MAG: D-glycero-beta-D-manno-heptose 1,7-bisphosphate 7-phosphatase [Magnetococcales bacterium]|nr:D-glycero-beta-D-manno-heptose 1,7-bisphosphate 7-phosphatase [Magnetococcales bacterium]MBF0156951.1 D-glycero-beta-D-manno-heptose 1,7-bisphosphate 7-phosphatase [Magnetococcales bacterium]